MPVSDLERRAAWQKAEGYVRSELNLYTADRNDHSTRTKCGFLFVRLKSTYPQQNQSAYVHKIPRANGNIPKVRLRRPDCRRSRIRIERRMWDTT